MKLKTKIEILVLSLYSLGLILVGLTGFVGWIYLTILSYPIALKFFKPQEK